MSDSLSLEDFMGYKTSGERGTFMKKWTKRKSRQLNMVLMPKDSIYALWRHPFPRLVETKDGDSRIWGGNYVCHEDKDPTLLRQFRRNDDGTRQYPPQRCGACKLIEWTHQQIESGAIRWTDTMFEFVGDDSDENRILHAGGITGAFGSNKLDEDEKRDLKQHGIKVGQSWMEKMSAQCNYMFVIIDFDEPKAGPQITTERTSLGDKVKGVIQDQRASLGPKGDPFTHPYVIQCEYDPDESKPFGDRYHARPMLGDKWAIDDTIREMLKMDPPDLSATTAKFNHTELRLSLQKHAKMDIPWDQLFGKLDPAEVKRLEEKSRPESSSDEKRKEPREERIPDVSSKPKTSSSSSSQAASEPADDLDQCAKCDDGLLRPDQDICPSCKWNHATNQYEVEQPKRRRRGEPIESTEQPAATQSKSQEKRVTEQKKTVFDDDTEGLPF